MLKIKMLIMTLLLSGCVLHQPVVHPQSSPSTTIPNDLLQPPCTAKSAGKSLIDLAKSNKHNAYCVHLYKKRLESIKELGGS